MANTYKSLNLDVAGGSDDKRVKVGISDTTAAFLGEKITTTSGKIVSAVVNPAGNSKLDLDIVENQIDHNALLNYVVDEHRPLNDALTTTTNLWSGSKIQDELDTKVDKVVSTDNALVRFDGAAGDVQNSGIVVDDLNNVTGVNDLVVTGDLTVNGTQTILNTQTVEIEDANITLNRGGTQASADSQNAGLTVSMSDATDAELGYNSLFASKFGAGEVGDTREILTTTHTQTMENKTISADLNTISELEVDNLKAGVLVTDLSVLVDNTRVAGAQAIKNYALAIADFPSSFDTRLATKTTTDLAEGTNLYFTDERAQDAVGTILTDTASIDFVYDDVLNTITANVLPAGVDHDALQNFVLNEHIDHSTVQVLAGEGLSGGGDITTDRTIALDIPNLTVAGSVALTQELAVYDTVALAHRKITVGDIASIGTSADDIAQTNFALAELQTAQPVTGFVFPTARSFESQVSVQIDATAPLFETLTIKGIKKASTWEISIQALGDESLVEFNITALGQITYTTPAYAGFVSGVVKFRATTTV